MAFWWLAALLLIPAAAFVAWPLVRAPGRARWAGFAVIFGVPALAAGLYFDVGTPAALDPAARQPVDVGARDMDTLAAQLRQRLEESPDNPEGWVLLGRTYKTLQRYEDALAALERADRLQPDHPVVRVELVEARLFASGDPRLTDEMVAELEAAVGSEPGLQKAYWLLGIAAAQRGDDRTAIQWWETLLTHMEAGSGVARSVAEQIAAARQRLGEDVSVAEQPDADPAAVSIPVTVELSGAAVTAGEDLPDQAAVFVIARAQGAAGGPPLAVRRIDAPRFPVNVNLTDADSMMVQRPLSSADSIEVQARLSLAGEAFAAPGDWESAPSPAGAGEPTTLVLDQQVE